MPIITDFFPFLLSVTGINAVVSLIALIVVVSCCRHKNSYWSLVLWFGHSALYWCTLMIARGVYHYTGPSILFSTWGAVVFFHAYLAVIGDRVLRAVYEPHPKSEPIGSLEETLRQIRLDYSDREQQMRDNYLDREQQVRADHQYREMSSTGSEGG